jgi:hypothetical protein
MTKDLQDTTASKKPGCKRGCQWTPIPFTNRHRCIKCGREIEDAND